MRPFEAQAVLDTKGPIIGPYWTSGQAVVSPGSSRAGRDDRNNKMAEGEEFRVGKKKNTDCDLLLSTLQHVTITCYE